ncbi:MAG TPA: hypothetical protein VF384_10340 [Planctomycetota bacterium]
MPRATGMVVTALTLLAACSSLQYDLASVPFPVSASPAARSAGAAEPFVATGKTVLWVHGLLGEDQADVAGLLRQACSGCDSVAEFRASAQPSFHDWLVTHLTLGFVRMKTVTVTGKRVKKGA